GAAVFVNGHLSASAGAPDGEDVMKIIDWLVENNTRRVFSTRQLSAQMPAAARFREKASGLLALEISRYNKEYILYFKPEITETRIWAGNPDKPQPGADRRIHPRKSFKNWEEVIRGKSQPWKANELEVTEILLKDITALLLRNQAEQLRQLNQELSQSSRELRTKNSRLEDFAYIVTHNLRSPLSNIRGLYSLYQSEPTNETAAEVLKRISVMADNIAATIEDLNLILKTNVDQQLSRDSVQVAEVIEKEKQNLQASMQASKAEIITELEVATLELPKVYLESIMHNLLSNALKYRSDLRQPSIRIRTWQDDEQVYLSVEDNGVGLNLAKVGNRMFGLYSTFHQHKDAKG
ncbi:MAG: hypothetical protein LPK03_11585, partial [Pontibacter sp.]|nr:hypothetical protein [Pontibacter sp.]